MSQYTDSIQTILNELKYIEDSEKWCSIEAKDGLYIVSYSHGGKDITVLRDNETHKEGDIITIPPDDVYYIKLKNKYHNKHPIIPRLVKWIKKCLTLK